MIRRHNVGRIPILIILANVIFGLIYFANNNDIFPSNTVEVETEIEEIVEKQSMQIFTDITVDGEYVTILENIISDQRYAKEELAVISSYGWYLTDNLNVAGQDMYSINDSEIVIFAADDNFINYVNDILSEIVPD